MTGLGEVIVGDNIVGFCYRLHPKNDGNIFSLFTPRGVTPVQLTVGGTAILPDGVYPILSDWGCTPILPDGGTVIFPDIRTGWGYPILLNWGEGTPILPDKGIPHLF